ncbi:unnamed protein product [Closterium sp. NIES-53]
MHNGASQASRLHASASMRTSAIYGCNAVQSLYCNVGTPSACCVGRPRFCSAGATPIRNAGRRSTKLCWRSTRLVAELLGSCRLLKSLYELKQPPVLWYRPLDGVLLDAGWKKSQVDATLYFKVGDNRVTYWVLVYVDDLLAANSSTAMLKELKELLEAAFELREISPVVKYLGLEIVRDRPARKSWLHQQNYADKLRRRFIDEERPELLELIGYVDADDAGDKQNRTSTANYVFVYGGVAISWSSSRIKCVTLSSTESEYVAATDADKEGRRLRFLLADFQQLDAWKPTILWVDNKLAIMVAKGLGLTGNLKHMERRYAWLQHMVRRGKFVLKYIPTTEQLTDFLTKALHFLAFNRCSVAISQVRLANVDDGDDEVQQ